MSSIISPSLYTSTLVISHCFLLFLLSPASSFPQPQPPSSPDQGLSFEEKARLGSTPPSCHNKCNGCYPCVAVQVPATLLPSLDRFSSKAITNSLQSFDPSGNQYSNYKPLSWKCRCGDHFYNP